MRKARLCSINQQTRQGHIVLALVVLCNWKINVFAWTPTIGRIGATIEVRNWGTHKTNAGKQLCVRSSSLLLAVEGDFLEDPTSSMDQVQDLEDGDDEVDVAIIGGGIGGLCAGAVLNTLYGKKVGVFESHYLPGGCAHAFDRKAANGMTFTFDSGPTILLG